MSHPHMTQRSPYQLFPDLTPDQFRALKSSIADRGVEVPIIVDQAENIIDGWHREQACQELGIFCPREVREFACESEKYELTLSLNCQRRQLDTDQKRLLIAA